MPNLIEWAAARGEPTLQSQIATDDQEAERRGMKGTRAFLIGRTGGPYETYEYTFLTDPSGFYEAIEAALAS